MVASTRAVSANAKPPMVIPAPKIVAIQAARCRIRGSFSTADPLMPHRTRGNALPTIMKVTPRAAMKPPQMSEKGQCCSEMKPAPEKIATSRATTRIVAPAQYAKRLTVLEPAA